MGLTFPAPGRSFEARFGDMAFRLDFDLDGSSLTFAPIGDDQHGTEGGQTVTYAATGVRPGVFMVTWQEAGGTTVTHVEDFDEGIVHTNITTPDGQFLNLAGTWRAVG